MSFFLLSHETTILWPDKRGDVIDTYMYIYVPCAYIEPNSPLIFIRRSLTRFLDRCNKYRLIDKFKVRGMAEPKPRTFVSSLNAPLSRII